MKYFLWIAASLLFLGALTPTERSHLRQMSLTFCECRGKTYFIAFDKDKPLAKVFCRNGESKVFYVTDKYEVCK